MKIKKLTIFVLFLLVIGMSNALVFLDKDEYLLDENVNIRFSNLNQNSEISIIHLQTEEVYKYLDGVNGEIKFRPKYSGEYLIRVDSYNGFELKKFVVIDPNSEELQKGQYIEILPETNSFLEIDKSEYLIGEIVQISLNSLEPGISISLHNNKDDYYFFGDYNDNIKFPVTEFGLHEIVVKDGVGNIIQKIQFNVVNEISQHNLVPDESIIENSLPSQTLNTNQKNVLWKEKVNIENSKNKKISHALKLFDGKGEEYKIGDSINTGKYDAEIKPLDIPVKKIMLNNLNYQGEISFGVDEVNKEFEIDDKDSINTFAIDYSNLDFSTGVITTTAKGNELWQCDDWDFDLQICNSEWQKIKDIIPGEDYEISFTKTSSITAYSETGVATVNTDKPIYHPDEIVDLTMVVLDTKGYLVFDADVTLTITDPNSVEYVLSTDNRIYEYMKGVYKTQFNKTFLPGVYTLDVSATGENVNSNLSSYFTVKDYYEFDIIRNTPVTIDPWDGPFDSSIKISSYNYNGLFSFTEKLPVNFNIYETNNAQITQDENYIYLTWNNLVNNSIVSYTANSPLVTPDLYELGPSYVTYGSSVFYEARPWYLAIDPTTLYHPYSSYSEGWNDGTGTTHAEINETLPPDTGDRLGSLAGDNVISEFGFPSITESGITNMTLYVYTETGGNAQYTFYLYQGATTSVCSQPVSTGTSLGWQSCSWNTPSGSYADMRVRLGGVTKSGGGKNTYAYVYTAYLEITYDNLPIVTLHEPDGDVYEQTSIEFNFTAVDDVDDPLPSCTLYGNFSGTWEANESLSNVNNNTKTSITVNGLDDGGYVWNVQCSDSSSSAFAPTNYSVIINANYPSITNTALNESVINQSHKVKFNATITDTFGISHSYINVRYPNGTTRPYTLNTNNDEHYYVITDTYQLGHYNVTLIWANDTYNQITQVNPTNLNFEVTASPPAPFNLLTPTTGKESQDLTPSVTWQQTQEPDFKNYTLLWDKDSDFSSPEFVYVTNLITSTSYTNDFALDVDSVYYWRVIAYDIYGNQRNSTSDFIYKTDNTDPSVVLNTPNNLDYVLQNTVTFNYTPSDTNTLDDCNLYGNFTDTGLFEINETEENPVKDTPNYLTTTVYKDGKYKWNVECNDTASNSDFAAADFVFYLDTTGPNITIIAPQNDTKEENTNNVYFTLNATDFLSDVASCELIINDVIEQTEPSIIEGVEFNFTDFMFNGDYNWSVNCSDEHGFETSSGVYNLSVSVIDSDPPFITLNSPGEDDYLSYDDVVFNYTPEDATGIENCSLYIDEVFDQINYSSQIINLNPNIFETFDINEGKHNWSVWCYDNSTEFNLGMSDTYDFTIDLTDPSVTLDNPDDEGFVSTSIFDFVYTPSDVNLDACTLYGNFTGSFLPSNVNNSPYTDVQTTFTKTLADGKYKWNVLCSDFSGRNSFALTNYTVKIDTSAPYYSNNITDPLAPLTYTPNGIYEFNITWEDNFGVNMSWLEHNFSHNYVNATVVSPENDVYNFTYYSLAAGTYYYRWFANDTLENRNQTPWYVYTVNRANSEIDLLLEETEGNYSMDEDNILNITAKLVQPSFGSLELYFNGTLINNDLAPLENLTLISNPGIYNITAKYLQTQNYSYSNMTWFLNVSDTTPPTIKLGYPENASFIGTNDLTFIYNVSDNSAILNCTLYLNDVYDQSDFTITKGIDQTFPDNLPDSNYSYFIRCYDSAHNYNTTEIYNFTVLKSDSILLSVSTNLPKYEIGDTANITSYAKDVFNSPMDTNVSLDIIKGNITINWWNHSWKKRMPVYLNETLALNHTQAIAQLNVTGIAGNISSCVNELRLVKNHSEQGYYTFEEIPFEVTAGDNNDYCTIKFKTNITANALEENSYYVYYNNSQGVNPNYDVLISGSYNYYAYESATDTGTPANVANIIGNNDATSATMSLSGGGAATESAHGRGFIDISRNDTITDVKVRYRYAVPAASTGSWQLRYSVNNGGLYQTSYLGSSTASQTTSAWDDVTADYASLTWSNLNNTRLQGYVSKPGGSGTITLDLYWVEMNVSVDFTVNITETRVGKAEELIDYSNSETGIDGEWIYNFETMNHKYGNYTAIGFATKDPFTDALAHAHFEIIPDTTPPNVTLYLPEDYYQRGIGYVNFTYLPYDLNLDNCTLYFNTSLGFTPNETQTNPVSSQNNTIADVYFNIGVYEWNVNCSDKYGNSGFAENNFTLNITGPDIFIETNKIFFSNDLLIEGLNITVFANITNIGLSDTQDNFTVQFYLGDPDLSGVQINGNKTIDNLSINEYKVVNISHELVMGDNDIYVLVDAGEKINESNEGNNKAFNTISVSVYHYYFGNTTSETILEKSDNTKFVLFTNDTTGHIFVSDTDSIFSFAELQALTRNINGDAVNNDFTEVDTNLATTGYTDSIKNEWGEGTDVPKLTRTFYLSSGQIDNVPIVNSTNTSNFVTGILWDTDDDIAADLQYDASDDEDLIFITELNIDSEGKYGVYDYEIRIPATLDIYKAGSDSVSFYLELT